MNKKRKTYLQLYTGLTTQISTRPRATKQGRVKCRHHGTIPVVLTQEAGNNNKKAVGLPAAWLKLRLVFVEFSR